MRFNHDEYHTRAGFSRDVATLALSIAALFLLSGCEKNSQTSIPSSGTTTLHVGYQKYGLLPIIKARGELDKSLKAQGVILKWVEFPAGPQLLEGLNVGSVIFGEAGEAPPIFAQAASPNLIYVANQPPAPLAEALIVPKSSNIKTVKDLKGKRVVLNKGSNVHYLLLKVLAANQLQLSDIQVLYLPPADARAAFEKGVVDAWLIWDPYFAAAQQQLGAKVIATGQELVSNHQFYLADRNFAQQYPKVLNHVIDELNRTTQWVSEHPDQAAQLLQKPTGLPREVLNTSISRMGFGVQAISPHVIQQQQSVADAFYQQKLIPKPIKIQDAIWPPKSP